MRHFAALLLFTASFAAQADNKADQRVYVESNLISRPVVTVILGKYYTLPEFPTQPFVGLSFEMQWTADGNPMPTNLEPFKAQCLYRSAQQYSCEAMKNWFWTPVSDHNKKGVKSLDSQAFYLPDMEYDTEYCFRFNADHGPWTQWSCARTPAAPALPPAPARPMLTLIAATSGVGVVGEGHPPQLLAEWNAVSSELLVAGYVVEMDRSGRFSDYVDPGSRTDGVFGIKPGPAKFERVLNLPADADPEGTYAVRVCTTNIAGKSCSLPGRVQGRGWAQKNRGQGSKLPQSAPNEVSSETGERSTARAAAPDTVAFAVVRSSTPPPPICDAARSARLRNSPAAPGLERQCLAAGGSLAAPPKAPAPNLDDLAAVGATIAAQDPAAAQARNAEAGAFYQLGFDIASGLFGDPALGSAGSTVMGPFSESIRNSLSAAGQRGFNASVAFHQARNYRH